MSSWAIVGFFVVRVAPALSLRPTVHVRLVALSLRVMPKAQGQPKRLRRRLRLCRRPPPREVATREFFLKIKFATSRTKASLTVDDQVVGRC